MIRRFIFIIILPVLLLTPAVYGQDEVLLVEWTDLMSQADLDAILNPPELTHDLYGWQEQLENNPEAQKAVQEAADSAEQTVAQNDTGTQPQGETQPETEAEQTEAPAETPTNQTPVTESPAPTPPPPPPPQNNTPDKPPAVSDN